jgi:hypothetical protein
LERAAAERHLQSAGDRSRLIEDVGDVGPVFRLDWADSDGGIGQWRPRSLGCEPAGNEKPRRRPAGLEGKGLSWRLLSSQRPPAPARHGGG